MIIANGSYKMGYGASAGTENCSSSYTWDCMMLAIPSGLSKTQPTRILGAGYATGCASKPELYGSQRPWAIVDMDGSSNIELQCLEITDRSQCVELHSGSISCNRDTYPYGDWASTGLRASDSGSVLLKNLDIHGLANTGVHAGRLADWTIESTKIEGNGWAGWDGDIDGSDGNTGTTAFKKVSISWNGCGETYPGRQPVGCWGQDAGGYGDGLGTGDTGGKWVIEDSEISHNTSDGLDLLYTRQSGASVTVTRVRAEGNGGNQIKTTGNATVTDSVLIGNCGYFDGKSFTHSNNNCRYLGNTVNMNFGDYGSTITLLNNSIYGEGDCLVIAEKSSGSGTVNFYNNALYGDTDYWQPSEKSCYFWSDGNITFNNDYNIVYNVKDNSNICATGSHNLCNTNPQFSSVSETAGFDLKLKSGSPAIDKGTNLFGVTALDYLGIKRPQGGGADMGAYEY